ARADANVSFERALGEPRGSQSASWTLQVFQDFLGRVAAVDAADATAGMRAGTAHIEPLDRRAVVGVAGDRPPAEQLIECQVTVHDVAANQPVLLLHVERPNHLAMLDG